MVRTASPPVFHATHWKAGSQWVRGVLADLYPDRIVEPQVSNEHVTRGVIESGRIYPTVYMPRDEFENVPLPSERVVFAVVRDLRDTLVSSYHSLLVSHPLYAPDGRPHPGLAESRRELATRTKEEGLIHLIEASLDQSAHIQRTWHESTDPVFRFEDLARDGPGEFARLLDRCGLTYEESALEAALERNSFRARSGGREPGQEDTASHFRKGISGDWRNHFSERVKDAFRFRFGEHLIRMGYEDGEGW